MHYLVSYKPLLFNKQGQKAIEEYQIPPYVDGSCRREPNFESEYPSITSLCRGEKFAPRLQAGDSVVYITVKKMYPPYKNAHWRLVAILNVIEKFETHQNAAEWYQSKGLKIPSNCMVNGNLPVEYEKTFGPIPANRFGQIEDKSEIIRLWDQRYKEKAQKSGTFLICKPMFLELHNPPVLTDETLLEIFAKIPATRNPPKISEAQFKGFCNLAFT